MGEGAVGEGEEPMGKGAVGEGEEPMEGGASFLKSGIPVLGVWDDHDYGMDRGGKHHRDRLQSQGIFLDFLNDPIDSIRRDREGVYASYLFGHGDKTVKVMLLSGDVHFGEFQCLNATSTGYPLYEVTSSGMTSVCVSLTSKKFCNWLLNDVAVSSFRFNDVITELNYGMVNIDWNKKPVEVSLEIRGQKGVYLQHAISLDHLSKRSESPRCPKAASPAPLYPRAMFWCSVYLLVALVLFILLRCVDEEEG
ncbi:hypothetical protein QZH41_014821, partial [Actinostola sp. cb2023]